MQSRTSGRKYGTGVGLVRVLDSKRLPIITTDNIFLLKKSINIINHMQLVIKKKLVFVLLYSFFIYTGCRSDLQSCYYVKKLNFPTEFLMRSPMYYAIEDPQILQQIKGRNIVGNYYQSYIEKIMIIKGVDTLDSNNGDIKLREFSGITCLRFHTARLQMSFMDSLTAMEEIRNEDILLELKNGNKIRLKYCQD